VKEITRRARDPGHLTQPLTYGKAKPTTAVPDGDSAFADNKRAIRILRDEGWVVKAEPLDTGGPWWQKPAHTA